MQDSPPAREKKIRYHRTMASPPYCLWTHICCRPMRCNLLKSFDPISKFLSLHIIRISTEWYISPCCVVWVRKSLPSSSEFPHVNILDSFMLKYGSETFFMEMRIFSWSWEAPHIDEKFDIGSMKKCDKILDRVCRVSNGVDNFLWRHVRNIFEDNLYFLQKCHEFPYGIHISRCHILIESCSDKVVHFTLRVVLFFDMPENRPMSVPQIIDRWIRTDHFYTFLILEVFPQEKNIRLLLGVIFPLFRDCRGDRTESILVYDKKMNTKTKFSPKSWFDRVDCLLGHFSTLEEYISRIYICTDILEVHHLEECFQSRHFDGVFPSDIDPSKECYVLHGLFFTIFSGFSETEMDHLLDNLPREGFLKAKMKRRLRMRKSCDFRLHLGENISTVWEDAHVTLKSGDPDNPLSIELPSWHSPAHPLGRRRDDRMDYLSHILKRPLKFHFLEVDICIDRGFHYFLFTSVIAAFTAR